MAEKEQDWISQKVDVRDSSLEGKGMFANSDIGSGEKLIVWGGNYINKQEVEKYSSLGKLIMQWDEDLYSYEDRGDAHGYFINHSCDSNMWMADAYTLVARKPIKTGEELTADYALWEADEDFVSSWECKCGTPYCRRRITGKDWRDISIQERYRDHFSPLINKRILREYNRE